jgi:hypothetical protein
MPFSVSEVLGGPVWWAILTLYLIVIGAAVFVRVDSLRAKRLERFSEMREPRLIYTGVATIYLICVVVAWTPLFPRQWALVPVLMTPIAFFVCTAYLLRVVYPKPVPALVIDDAEND